MCVCVCVCDREIAMGVEEGAAGGANNQKANQTEGPLKHCVKQTSIGENMHEL